MGEVLDRSAAQRSLGGTLQQRITVGLFLLVLAIAVSAQGVTPEIFTQKVSEWIEANDLLKVVQAVRFQSEVGKQAFDKVLKVHQSAPSPFTEKWLNHVGRAFRLEGRKEQNQALMELGILWPNTKWRGTLFEDDQVVDTRGTVAQNVKTDPSVANDHFQEALAATHLAVRVGNDFALPSMFGALKAHAEKNPELPELGEIKILEVSALDTTGLWSEALEKGRDYSESLSGSELTLLHLAMLSSARKLEKPTEVDRLLELLKAESQDPLADFIIESVAFQRDCQTGNVSMAEMTRRHVAVWRNFRTDRLESIPGGLGRQLVEAAGIWVHEAVDRMQRETEEFPDRAQLYYIVWEDLKTLRRLSKNQMAMQFQPDAAQTFLRLWNPEFMLATQALELEVVAAWRRNGQQDHARVLLSEVEASVQETWEDLREAGLGYQLAHYGKPIKLENGQFEFVWTIGEAPRMVALQRMEKARLRNDVNAIEEAIVYQKDARTQGGFLGLEDARFLKVESLLNGPRPRPSEAAALNAELSELCVKNDYRPGKIVCLINSAELAKKSGDSASARKSAEDAVVLIEEYLTEAGGDGAIRKRFRRAYEMLAELQLEAGENEEAFATLARLSQAESLMTLDTEQLASKRPGLKKLVKQLEKTRTRGQALSQAKENQTKSGKSSAQMNGQIASNRSEFYQALGDIRRQYPGYGQMLAVRPVNFARMQKFVPDDTVVVQLFPAQDSLFLFVLTKDKLKIEKVAVSQAEIERLAKSAREGLLASKHRSLRDRAGRVVLQAKKASSAEGSLKAFAELHKYIVDPIAEDIEPYKVVAFIPSGTLMNVPLQALARESGKSLDFLIERKQVVTLLKSTDLERLARAPSSSKREGTLVIGNPDGTLPGAALEAKSIASLYGNAKVLIEDEATLSRVKAGTDVKYLHLATHGILNKDNPNLSYLVLGKGDKLDIGEIAGLELDQVRMVTLSACETALGEDPTAQGELTTLADAFGFAGCPTVTASLWKVSDDSTKLLMETFYTELKGGATPASAIQTAQQALLKNKETRHPYHWAAFLLIGDWR